MFSQAEAYERFMGRWSRELAVPFVGFADGAASGSFLDVGCGTGALSLALRAARPAARITAIDPSSAFVAAARERLGDAGVEVRVGDAMQLDFPDGAFDAAVSGLVLNFVRSPPRAASEMARVTRAGGTVAAMVWDYGGGMEMLRCFWDEAGLADRSARARDEASMPLCREGEIGALLRHAGLEDVREKAIEIRLRFASFEDYWAPFLLGQGPAGAYVASLGAEGRASLASRLRRRILGDGPDATFEMAARAWAASGTVAARR